MEIETQTKLRVEGLDENNTFLLEFNLDDLETPPDKIQEYWPISISIAAREYQSLNITTTRRNQFSW